MHTLNQTEMNQLTLTLNSVDCQNDIKLTKDQIEERQLQKIRINVRKYVEDTKAQGFVVSEALESYVNNLDKA